MASALVPLQSLLFASSSKHFPLNVPVVPQISTAFYSSAKNVLPLKLRPPRASSEGIPTELTEDSKFVPLNPDDPIYGPPALLLLGFEVEEEVKIRQLLKELDGEFLQKMQSNKSEKNSIAKMSFLDRVIYCTEDMITRSLWEAMNTKQSNLEALKIAKGVPRICFLSGLSGEETMMFIDAFPETGLEGAVFAALVPNSADKPLQELIEEIMGDHEMLSGELKG